MSAMLSAPTDTGPQPKHPAFHDWNSEQIALLTQLWGEGLVAREIGKRMGITSRAVLGKSHRLKLPKRLRGYAGFRRNQGEMKTAVVRRVKTELTRATYSDMPTEKKPCQFPLWGDEKPTHEYCGADRIIGKPYCAEHSSRCFIAISPRGAG